MEAARYQLSLHAFLCVGSRYCVVLDVNRDRYLTISRDQFEAMGPWLKGWTEACLRNDFKVPPPPKVMELAAQLRRQGILTAAGAAGKPVQPQNITTPTADVLRGAGPIGPGRIVSHGLQFLWAVAFTRRQFKTGCFATMIRNAGSGRDSGSGAENTQLVDAIELVAIFEWWRRFYSRPYICLFDSICLRNFLARFGFFPSLVFGVIAEPFQAHCWLQAGATVLNDTVERVRCYTPIMCI